MRELTKVFEHAAVDPRWYAYWEEIGAFRADPESGRPPFSMVLPPPNVTGWLHIGHALNQTLPDIVARWKRMKRVRRALAAGDGPRRASPRRTWSRSSSRPKGRRRATTWAARRSRRASGNGSAKSHGTITSQMRKLGSSVDWSRERFTLDETLSHARSAASS